MFHDEKLILFFFKEIYITKMFIWFFIDVCYLCNNYVFLKHIYGNVLLFFLEPYAASTEEDPDDPSQLKDFDGALTLY